MPTTAEWLDAWVRGWVASRATPPAAAVPGGWHVAVGADDDRERTFLRSPEHLVEAALLSTASPSRVACLAPLGDGDSLTPPPGWARWPSDHLMLGGTPEAAAADLPTGYRAESRGDERRALVEIRTTAAGHVLAAGGQVGVADGVAVPDRIRTQSDHRRRGLGRALMRILGTEAARRGATASVLSASADGFRLYSALGWTAIARFPSFSRSS